MGKFSGSIWGASPPKLLPRNEIIKALVNDDMDITNAREGFRYLHDMLHKGFKGYDNYTNEELAKVYFKKFDEKIRVT